jgi:hypothetical protein
MVSPPFVLAVCRRSVILSFMHDVLPESILERVASAPSFLEAAERLTDWAQALTGCQAAMLRFREDDPETDGWIPALVERGFGCRFLRDEILIGQEECLCGRVCRGAPDGRFPFFTPGGSFSWGGVQNVTADYPIASLGKVRGRCITEGFDSVVIAPLLGEDGSPLGCLHLADFAPDKFSDHVGRLETVCRLCGPLLQGFSSKDREAAVIRAVEAALTPAELHPVSGLEVAVSYTSATEAAHLGGDFYDVIELDDEGLLLVVGGLFRQGHRRGRHGCSLPPCHRLRGFRT